MREIRLGDGDEVRCESKGQEEVRNDNMIQKGREGKWCGLSQIILRWERCRRWTMEGDEMGELVS
ncbi:hypothetical protein E2C01_032287 [Portunus trituberculatus]|uniref:Uncharacterized protein n=1 Tax=Portunus trituberculatus TaxID=210409 RepID=A0A5B7F0Y9_PORTR|nr:hypothetical protein [Portunus trituberculatus]